MGNEYFTGATVDDVMRHVVEALAARGEHVSASRGCFMELTGVFVELTDPRARLSRTESRGKPFSSLGELCWYLAGTNRLDFIEYYIPKYKDDADGDVVYGGYGPRLLSWRGQNQIKNVIERMQEQRTTRRAVIQLFDADDLAGPHKDLPCTCVIQFLVREDKLHTITYMRSNDAHIGFPHDVFCFTMLQELVARSLEIEMGTYRHVVGSLHLYDHDREKADAFLSEGYQSTKEPMPSMPIGDPWAAVAALLKAESLVRAGLALTADVLPREPYWADLVRLLQIFFATKAKDGKRIAELRDAMSCRVYDPFIGAKLA